MKAPDRFIWYFTGVRADRNNQPVEMARWHLRFFLDSRRFSVRALPQTSKDREMIGQLPLLPEMRATNLMTGPVTPLLRARLRPEHITEATAAALRYDARRRQ